MKSKERGGVYYTDSVWVVRGGGGGGGLVFFLL